MNVTGNVLCPPGPGSSSIPTTTDDVQCGTGSIFACQAPVVDCTDPTQYLITKLT